jgi:hypothetical protein
LEEEEVYCEITPRISTIADDSTQFMRELPSSLKQHREQGVG